MSFIENKKDIANNLSLLEVLNGLPKNNSTSSLSSVYSKNKNLVPYLIDLLSITCGDDAKSPKDKARCSSKTILNEILTEFFYTLIRILKEGIVKGIKSGLSCGADFTVPTVPIEIKLKLSEIDYNGLLKINPNSNIGATFYGKSSNTDINWFLNDLIQNGGTVSWQNLLKFSYDQTTEELTISVDVDGQGKKFEEFTSSYLDSSELFSLDNFMTRLVDNLTGSLSSSFLPSLDQIISQEKVNQTLKNLNNTDPCQEEYKYDNSYFTFTNDELFEIEKISNEKVLGETNLDLGCGLVPSSIDPNTFKAIFENLRQAPSNQANLVIEESLTTIDLLLTANVPDSDKNLSIESLNTKMIESIPIILTSIIFEPKIVVLYLICSKMVNGPLFPPNQDANIKVNNSFDFSKSTKVFFEYVGRESLAALIEIVYKKLKREIILLVTKTTTNIVKEQTKLKYKILTGAILGTASSTLVGLVASKDVPNTSEFV